ncbi:hypothetical protein A5788_00985 [Gordonia sp. 852002-50816_SCH5313054-c]|uniref:hypothetical protein n=1 Tax=unclassified Gordonia (in: high G+C Gram-positive bacteria) TaxID=2657482 RepID=UPI0007EA9B38|nr:MULTISPECIES: hypothetical protein [unclassified Gordonia (in: high G+C Gram-positive bacteria)]OBC12778.1 hypothetical protein A5786_00460 [Gordonia sp. 852002-50816_SCH5313054-a]OBC18773.1 hypothetical protein A5788_00985 [Gordonia sp. 852002-50816_SCH5313054-c]
MSSSYSKTPRKCSTCGAPLFYRRDVTTSESGTPRVDAMLVCRNEGCSEPALHLKTEHPDTQSQPA